MTSLPPHESLAYHSARLLLLIAYCGKPRSRQSKLLPGIEGRMLLAKLDFFLRYPAYLQRAASILRKEFTGDELGFTSPEETRTIESRMVRYLYGPWDHIYYSALAYLIGKGLIVVEKGRGSEVFRLTPLGGDLARQLAATPEYESLVRRADAVYHLFNAYTGTRLKDFIYFHFPEVVNRRVGATI